VVYQCDADLDFGHLVLGVPCGDALAEGFQAPHLRLNPAPDVIFGPAFSEGLAVVPGGAQSFVSGDLGRSG